MSNRRHRSDLTGLYVGKQGRTNPSIPTPEKREIPVVEELVHVPHPGVANRPLMKKERERILIPHFNRMYGTLRTENGWKYIIDNYANGTITDIAGAQAIAPVSLHYPPNWRLEQWPGGTNLYYCIRMFSLASQIIAATAGSMDVYYQDILTGFIVPLGDYEYTQSGIEFLDIVLPVPVSDPGLQNNVGQLQFNLSGAGTPETINWQLSFSGAYLLPDIRDDEIYTKGGPQHETHHHAFD
jgi:hypothetical protein